QCGDEYVGAGGSDPQPDPGCDGGAELFELECAPVFDGCAVSAGWPMLGVGGSDEASFRMKARRFVFPIVAALYASAVPGAHPPAAQGPDYNAFYQIGPDSLPHDGVPKGEVRGP